MQFRFTITLEKLTIWFQLYIKCFFSPIQFSLDNFFFFSTNLNRKLPIHKLKLTLILYNQNTKVNYYLIFNFKIKVE
jgi:hypothetical protein